MVWTRQIQPGGKGGGGEQFLIHEKLAQWTTFQEHDLLIKNKSNIKFAFPGILSDYGVYITAGAHVDLKVVVITNLKWVQHEQGGRESGIDFHCLIIDLIFSDLLPGECNPLKK